MRYGPYSQFRGQKLTLNDYLAIDRTTLANERTVLAYSRTALALVIVGGSSVKFFESAWIQVLGILFLATGVLVAVRGWQRYVRTKQLLAAALEQETGAAEHPLKENIDTSSDETAEKDGPEAGPRGR